MHVFNSRVSKVQKRNVELGRQIIKKKSDSQHKNEERDMGYKKQSKRQIIHSKKSLAYIESQEEWGEREGDGEEIIFESTMVKNLPTLTKRKILEAADMIDRQMIDDFK